MSSTLCHAAASSACPVPNLTDVRPPACQQHAVPSNSSGTHCEVTAAAPTPPVTLKVLTSSVYRMSFTLGRSSSSAPPTCRKAKVVCRFCSSVYKGQCNVGQQQTLLQKCMQQLANDTCPHASDCLLASQACYCKSNLTQLFSVTYI